MKKKDIFSSVIVQGVSQAEVAEFLIKNKRQAEVSATINNFTLICDKLIEDNKENLKSFVIDLTRHFSCIGLAIIDYDTEICEYFLYQSGMFLDEYCSSITDNEDSIYLLREKAKTFCEVFQITSLLYAIEFTLNKKRGEQGFFSKAGYYTGYFSEYDRLADLFDFVGIPIDFVGASWNAIYIGDYIDQHSMDSFIKIVPNNDIKELN